MSYTKRKWLPDILNYPNEPKQIITGVKVEIQPNYFKRLFDTILPETDAEYMKEKDEIEANVKLVCAAPDLLEALIALKDYCKYHQILLGSGIIHQIDVAIDKAIKS